jgi:hypothetical protein
MENCYYLAVQPSHQYYITRCTSKHLLHTPFTRVHTIQQVNGIAGIGGDAVYLATFNTNKKHHTICTPHPHDAISRPETRHHTTIGVKIVWRTCLLALLYDSVLRSTRTQYRGRPGDSTGEGNSTPQQQLICAIYTAGRSIHAGIYVVHAM